MNKEKQNARKKNAAKKNGSSNHNQSVWTDTRKNAAGQHWWMLVLWLSAVRRP